MLVSKKKLGLIVALAIAVSGSAFAKDSEKDKGQEKQPEVFNQYIYTPTLQKDPTDVFTCRVVNIGKKEQVFDINILSSQGKPMESQAPALLQPGFTSSDSTNTKNTIGYCRVGVKGSVNGVLVTFCTQSATSSACNAVVTGVPGSSE